MTQVRKSRAFQDLNITNLSKFGNIASFTSVKWRQMKKLETCFKRKNSVELKIIFL